MQQGYWTKRDAILLIIDLTIPGGMREEYTMRKLKEIDTGVKAFISSGYSNDPVLDEFEKYGFKGLATKPYIIEDLNKVVKQEMVGS